MCSVTWESDKPISVELIAISGLDLFCLRIKLDTAALIVLKTEVH
jgi:hypothetical protein